MRLTVCVSPARLEPTGHGDASGPRTVTVPPAYVTVDYHRYIVRARPATPGEVQLRPGLRAAARAPARRTSSVLARACQPAPGRSTGAGAHRGIIRPASWA